MKKSLPIKVTAFILCTVTLIVTALSVLAAVFLWSAGFYTRPLDAIRKDALHGTMSEYAHNAALYYHYDFRDRQLGEYTGERNLYFEIYDPDEKLVYSNFEGQETVFGETFEVMIEEWVEPDYDPPETGISYDTGISEETARVTEPNEISFGYGESIVTHFYTVKTYLPSEYFTRDLISFIDFWVKAAYSLKTGIYAIGGISLLLFIVLLIVLCAVSGWKKGEEKPRTCLFDKIPFDIFTGIYAFSVVLWYLIFANVYFEDLEIVVFILASTVIGALLIVSYIYSLAARAKTGELLKNTVIWFIIKHMIAFCRFTAKGIRKIIYDLPAFAKTLVLMLVFLLWSCMMLWGDPYRMPIYIILWVLGGTITVLFSLYITYGIDKLRSGCEQISKGDYSRKIDTKYLIPSLRHHANALNNISAGMSSALDARVKSERFKTELITNVSHDLKTPLTSIVNYVDLIKNERAKDAPDDATLDEYIEILERQSGKLKKLTEDLVEASKASTGNLEVTKAEIDLPELASQIEGEYSERLALSDLELIMRTPSSPLSIMADGKHIWRVIDNLMSNIIKYALPGTRVYIDMFELDGKAYIMLRNTSKYELNMTSEEIAERFARGDTSRHTEGSGLGLSIARSLTELSGGKLDIYIDGDLFKVVITFQKK